MSRSHPDDARTAEADLTADVARRTAGATVADGGPWVRRRPEAVDEAASGGRPAGPLDRLLVGVKDLVAVAGLPLGAGTRARADASPEVADADVVRRLRAAGAIVTGTLALHELAFGVTGINDRVGFPGHPHEPDRIPGGSSSGAAVAVADGSCDLAVGTDTGGSVRIPAALCGVVGYKPSRGRYPLDRVLALAPSLDHVGVLARSTAVVIAAHRAVTGELVAVDPSTSPDPPRLGVDQVALDGADDHVAAAVRAALAALEARGCTLVDVSLPDPGRIHRSSTAIMFREAAVAHRELVERRGDLLGADVAHRLATGASVTAAEYRAARDDAVLVEVAVRTALADVEAVVGPTVPVTAPTIHGARSDPDLPARLVSCTRPANLAGVPAVTLPVAGHRLPVGLQLVARSDAAVLHVAAAVERLLGGPDSGLAEWQG